MFKCESCGVIVPENTPANLVVDGVRPRHYKAPPDPPTRRGKKGKRRKAKDGFGWEPVRRIHVCDKCAAVFEERTRQQVEELHVNRTFHQEGDLDHPQ